MKEKQSKIGKNGNKLTTNRQVTDSALTCWECVEHISKMLMRTNMNSYYRDRLARLKQRLQKEAIDLGNDLSPANPRAFETIHATNLVAKQMGLVQ